MFILNSLHSAYAHPDPIIKVEYNKTYLRGTFHLLSLFILTLYIYIFPFLSYTRMYTLLLLSSSTMYHYIDATYYRNLSILCGFLDYSFISLMSLAPLMDVEVVNNYELMNFVFLTEGTRVITEYFYCKKKLSVILVQLPHIIILGYGMYLAITHLGILFLPSIVLYCICFYIYGFQNFHSPYFSFHELFHIILILPIFLNIYITDVILHS